MTSSTAQWTKHFSDMASGKIPPSSTYLIGHAQLHHPGQTGGGGARGNVTPLIVSPVAQGVSQAKSRVKRRIKRAKQSKPRKSVKRLGRVNTKSRGKSAGKKNTKKKVGKQKRKGQAQGKKTKSHSLVFH